MPFDIATNLIAFVLVLGFLIFAHESGHFLFAKLFKVRVLVFSFGFGKRLFGFKRGDTDYRVSLIPLGGYVRMAGDVPDEGREGHPDEFLSRPKWQRFLILFAGPAFNLLIAVGFLTGINMIGTEVLRDNKPILGSVLKGRPAEKAGLKAGDRIVNANGHVIDSWEDFRLAISMNPNTPVRLTVMRGTSEVVTTIVPERQDTDYGVAGVAGVEMYYPTEIGRVDPKTPMGKAGLQPGDRIVGAGDRPIWQLSEFADADQKNSGKPLSITVQRGNRTFKTVLPAATDQRHRMRGFIPPTVSRQLGFSDALRESVAQNWKMIRYAGVVLGRMFRMQGSVKEFSGPINIARISGEMLRAGWVELIFLMSAISLQLGIMNLLPIPVLDGGHIAILLVEGVARRDLSLQFKERIQQIGFAALALLMIVVLYNDVIQNVMRLRGS